MILGVRKQRIHGESTATIHHLYIMASVMPFTWHRQMKKSHITNVLAMTALVCFAGAGFAAPKQNDAVDGAKIAQAQPPMHKTPSGLQYQDLVVGNGASPRMGQTVSVHYTGWLTNGTKFDSSLDRGQPLEFPIGMGNVIKGWDEGVSSMRVGGRRKLVIPPNLAYGANPPTPKIPPNSTLVFDVQLLGIK